CRWSRRRSQDSRGRSSRRRSGRPCKATSINPVPAPPCRRRARPLKTATRRSVPAATHRVRAGGSWRSPGPNYWGTSPDLLAVQVRARGRVRPVHLAVAVGAAAREQEARGLTPRQTRSGCRHTRVIRLRVTLLTQQRRSAQEQGWIDRAMRRMTIAAILRDRRVLPQERTALFRVAGIASLVQRRTRQQRRIQRVVGSMAGGAGHVAVAHRMGREFLEVGAYLLMALVTNHRLFSDHGDRIVLGMQPMTADASDILALVHAALPS